MNTNIAQKMTTKGIKTDYILEDSRENERLARQNRCRNYKVIEELSLSDYGIYPNQTILDAGCGTGEISKFLLQENEDVPFSLHMADLSLQRLEEGLARINVDSRVSIKLAKLEELPYEEGMFDKIFCRFVYQHLQNHQIVTNELHRVLAQCGELIIIDVNGLMFDLVTDNEVLNKLLRKVKNEITIFEPYVCGKIPGYLYRAGFSPNLINIETKYMKFLTKEDRENEVNLFRERFEQIRPTLLSILGEKDCSIFETEFLKEIANPESYMQYEKKIIRAVKSKLLQ